jgi:hypothetical protein
LSRASAEGKGPTASDYLDRASALLGGLKGGQPGARDSAVLGRAYAFLEGAVLVLKLELGDESAPFDASLENRGTKELLSIAIGSLGEAMAEAVPKPEEALKHARASRDCLATILHSLNLDAARSRRTRR